MNDKNPTVPNLLHGLHVTDGIYFVLQACTMSDDYSADVARNQRKKNICFKNNIELTTSWEKEIEKGITTKFGIVDIGAVMVVVSWRNGVWAEEV